jgi:hypothetical protein
MKKIVLLFLFSITLLSCTEKEKTYEELEAEVLCDVLPEVAKYELDERLQMIFPPPPPPENGNNIDSQKYKITLKEWEDYKIEIQKNNELLIQNLNKYKKAEYGVLDTLRQIYKFKNDNVQYKFDSLDIRRVDVKEFTKCNLKINLVAYKNTFEGDDRNSDNPLLFLSRVLIDAENKNACFSVFKYYQSLYIFCEFSEKEQKWVVKEIIKE